MHIAPCPPGILTTTLFNGCKVAYTDDGSGDEALLFIHGLGAYGGTWQKNIDGLRDHFRCIAIDLPGNGCSGTGDYPYTMDFFARSVVDFIGRLGLRRVTLVGHSMGGQIALTAALMMPACCERIVLCAPAGFEEFTLHERLMYRASMAYMSWLTDSEQATRHLVRSSFYHHPEDAAKLERALLQIAERQPAQHYKKMADCCIAAMIEEPVAARLSRITQPVIVFFGEQDALIPNKLLHPTTTKKVAESGIRKLRRGKLCMIPRCGHFVQWEGAAVVNRTIREWMQLTASGRS